MFTFDATPVTFIGLLILFTFSTVWSIVEVTRSDTARARISNVLHLAMALLMLLMVSPTVWEPFHSVFPMSASTALMALGVVWFAYLAVRGGSHRAHYVGHALMFAAMTWHLVGMGLHMSHMDHGAANGMDHGAAHGMDHGAAHGMDHGAHDPMLHSTMPGGALWWLALLGLPLMAYLLFASVRDIIGFFRPAGSRAHGTDFAHTHATGSGQEPLTTAENQTGQGQVEPDQVGQDRAGQDRAVQHAHSGTEHLHPDADTAPGGATLVATVDAAPHSETCHPEGSLREERLTALSGFCMNFGMFWMSTGLLVPILPWMAALAI